MTIFNVFTLLGGVAFFLFGMNTMSGGLEKMAGGKLEKTLKKMTSNPLKSLLLGAGITIAIQSSSALTVMLVGLVNSGIMALGQTIGVIMGSNIGTTLTAWLLSLAGIKSDNFFINLLNPSSFSPILAFIGIAMIMVSKSTKKKDIGEIFVGFAILMYGMELMSGAVSPLGEMPEFSNILIHFKNPILSVIVGAVFTGIIQSSAASVGILQALSLTGEITYSVAIPIIMGQNIGTCVTALISSIGVNKNAKRVAAVHIYFNVIGTIICLIVFYTLNYFFRFNFVDSPINPLQIAFCHSVFNIFTTLVLLPFSKGLEKLARLTIKDNREQQYSFIDERLLLSPSFAVSECRNMTIKMAEIAKNTIFASMDIIKNFNEKKCKLIRENEEQLDMYEDKLGSYLLKLSGKELSDADSKEISMLLHTIGDFERLGDHAVNVLNAAQEIDSKMLDFSPEAKEELKVAEDALTEIINLTLDAFISNDASKASGIEPLEQVIDDLISNIKTRHVKRLRSGDCTIELGFVLSDILSNYERISDHCSNIAVSVIEINNASFDTHEYLNELKKASNPEFINKYAMYQKKFILPD